MKKVRSEFLTEKEADRAMEKIKPYCGNIEVLFYGGSLNSEYNGYDSYSHIPDETYMGFPEMGMMGLGGFGMIASWSYVPYSLTDNYRHNMLRSNHPHSSLSGHGTQGRAVLEADVSDDNFEYVKDKLYSLGAVTVT